MTLHVAILGSGNIGTDLMYKVIRNPALELAGVAGADPSSEGLARARALGIATTDRGVGPFLAEHPEVRWRSTPPRPRRTCSTRRCWRRAASAAST
jgi:Acetaldehyde dehydrogenase (acetylating)